MGASINEIIPDQLYLGDLGAATSLDVLTSHRITHILTVCKELSSAGPNIKHTIISVNDSHFDDLLVELPAGCTAIQNAIDEGGRILVHCQMGVSRSATVVIAYLMKSRNWTPSQAIRFLKERRPVIYPNESFLRQLSVFHECGYDLSPTHPVYLAWKDTHEKASAHLRIEVVNVVSILPDELYFSTGFPRTLEEARALLEEQGITQVVTITPSKLNSKFFSASPSSSTNVTTQPLDIPLHQIFLGITQEKLVTSLPAAVGCISNALASNSNTSGEKKNKVLIHSLVLARASVLCIAYMMKERGMSVDESIDILKEALPLFVMTNYLRDHLAVYLACNFNPTVDSPEVKEWVKKLNGD